MAYNLDMYLIDMHVFGCMCNTYFNAHVTWKIVNVNNSDEKG